MITIKFNLKDHLAEYLRGKYNNADDSNPISFPESDDLYHFIWQLMRKRPAGVSPVDHGNVWINLGDRRIGKDPKSYNYLEKVSIKMIGLKVEALFFMELHQRIDDNRYSGYPFTTIQIVHHFLCEYDITSISEDALIKNDYRWREKIRRRGKKRLYHKSVK